MSGPRRRAVFLDRDGTINQAVVRYNKPYPPANVGEFHLIDGAAEAMVRLKKAGFLLVVVTNQPDVARGTARREDIEAINDALRQRVPVDEVDVCYDDGESPRRKPNPGMLLEAAVRYNIDLPESFMVGDRWKDVEAGRRAGCKTVFLDSRYAEKKPTPPADFTTETLLEAAQWILRQS